MKKFLFNLAFGLLCWLIMMIAVLFLVAEIVQDRRYEYEHALSFGIPEYQLTDEITKAGCFRIHKHNGLTIHYERKMRLI